MKFDKSPRHITCFIIVFFAITFFFCKYRKDHFIVIYLFICLDYKQKVHFHIIQFQNVMTMISKLSQKDNN